jgi:putative phosphoserine phosphatase/1-acylglycerol-3-phosphate O-acyltransferase
MASPAGGRSAAFFDLDRTLLSGGSGHVFTEAMRSAGLISRSMPGEKVVYELFSRVGENLPSMMLARQAATMARGRSRSAVQAAAAAAADVLVGMIQPFAGPVIQQHKAAGRRLVMATTTPVDLVRPLSERLGFDDVVATTYGVNADGTYDGTIVGPFVWANGKLEAVREWAARNDIDMGESYAYSDSVYDTPLLSAVGHPVAVNPDPRMLLMAFTRRWPVLHLDVPPGVPKLPILDLEPQQIALAFTRPSTVPYARWDIAGVEHIPAAGPAILVGNHRSYFDALAMTMVIAKSGRTARFLGKKEVFDVPIVGQLAKAMGGIRVERASGSDEPLRFAAEALEAGQMVALMPQGTIPRGRAFFDPELKGRWGAARLAAMTRAPVIPVGMWGTEKVWPRSSRLPRVLNVADPPVVRVRVGPPVELKHRSPDADTKRIMRAIVDLLPPEARQRRDPTKDELRLTFPPGYKGDPDAEDTRRPGTD